MRQLVTNILCLLFILLSADVLLASELNPPSHEALRCQALLASGFDSDFKPLLELGDSRASIRRPLIKRGDFLAKDKINEEDLAKKRAYFRRVLQQEERAKIFFFLVDHPDMIFGRLMWELMGRTYRVRHEKQVGDKFGGAIVGNVLGGLVDSPQLVLEIMRQLSRATEDTTHIKYEKISFVPTHWDKSQNDEFYDGEYEDLMSEHIIPIVPGALKSYLDTDPYWQRRIQKNDTDNYNKIRRASIELNITYMKDFFEWLFARKERTDYATELLRYSLLAMQDLSYKWHMGGRKEYSLLSKSVFRLILGVGGDRGVLDSYRMGQPNHSTDKAIIEKVSNLSKKEKKALQAELRDMFRTIYNTKKSLAYSMGALDSGGGTSIALEQVQAAYTEVNLVTFLAETKVTIDKVKEDILFSVESEAGYTITTVNLESLLVESLAKLAEIELKALNFQSKARNINQQIRSYYFGASIDEVRIAATKKAQIIESLKGIDTDLQTSKRLLEDVQQTLEEAIALYDSRYADMNELHKAKARHVKEIYEKFLIEFIAKLELLEKIRFDVETETQQVDVNLLESLSSTGDQ